MINQMLQVQEPSRPSIQELMNRGGVREARERRSLASGAARSASCPPAVDRQATIAAANRHRPAPPPTGVARGRGGAAARGEIGAPIPTGLAANPQHSRRRDRSASPATRGGGELHHQHHRRGRATDIAPRPPTAGRARSRSPVVDAASRLRQQRGRARSVSPSQLGNRRGSGANGPSPLAGGGGGGDGGRAERQMTPEAPHCVESAAPQPNGPITATKMAPNQAAMGPARRALVIPTGVRGVGKQNPWALPPIEAQQSGRPVNPWRR
jgi:hypothetical protein